MRAKSFVLLIAFNCVSLILIYWLVKCDKEPEFLNVTKEPVLHDKPKQVHLRKINLSRRFNYTIIANCFPREVQLPDDVITFSTQSTVGLVEPNLNVISWRWDGPITVAVFAPKEQFAIAVNLIVQLRLCDVNIREKVNCA